MTKKQFFLFLFISILILPFLFLVFWPSQKLVFIVCNVGQGDALLITRGFTQILIDGGPNDKVLDCLTENIPFWDRTIELVVNTHPDKDHLAGLVEVVKRYQVKQILANSLMVDTQVFKDFQEQILEQEIPVYSPKKGERIKIAGLEFKTLWPTQQVLGAATLKQKTNENSIVLHLQYQDFDAILTGDITSKEGGQIVQDYQFQDIEVLKVAHHGSKYSSSREFLEKINPGIAVISVGKNSWGHPTKEVLERLQSVGSQILRTDEQKIKLKI